MTQHKNGGIQMLNKKTKQGAPTMTTTEAPPKPVPSALTKQLDELVTLRAKKARADLAAAKVKAAHDALLEAINLGIKDAGLDGVENKVIRVRRVLKVHPQANDWMLTWNYIHKMKGKADDLVQRRLSSPAVKERWEAKVAIPGVGKFENFEPEVTVLKRGRA